MSLLLSIVLPVHGVERFLPRCLDSILGDTPAAESRFEVIAVDDLSPDGSGAILDEYAARDPRLRVLHLTENQGLGGARAAALPHARGEYVWFVDSDDWLPERTVSVVLDELRHEGRQPVPADVLITDFTHVYPDGETEPNPWRHVLLGSPLVDGCTLAEHPELFQTVMSVWNKVFRRAYLEGLGVSFGRGYYEDISVTYPALLAAGRLRYLDRPCYVYRRGRDGAITATASPKHADVFTQYDAIFAFLDRPDRPGQPVPAALRTLVFDRTVRQALNVYDTPGLVPGDRRKEFFRRISQHFARHRPDGYQFPGGVRGVQYRLAARGARIAYAELRRTGRLPRELKRGARAVAPAVKKGVRSGARFTAYNAFRRLPLDEHLAVYAAYWHRGYACSPAAIYEKAKELAPRIRGVWVVENRAQAATMPPGVPYVIVNTPAYLKVMATAKYFVNNVNFPRTMAKRPGTVHVQTQHGTPLKAMGMDLRDRPEAADGMDFGRLQEAIDRWDFLVSSNPHTSEHFARAFPGRYEMLDTGYPRNDRLANATPDEVRAMRERIGLRPGRTSVLYAPTHREAKGGYVPLLDVKELARRLGPSYTLLVRTHYFHTGGPGDLAAGEDAAEIVDVSAHPTVEDLYLAADVLVTDYSSMMFDYAVLDRPIVVFAPDWDEYRRVRGVYFDLFAEPPGAVTVDVDGLAKALLAGDADPAARARFRARFCPWDDGGAAERVVRRVFPV
ncbi:bifunctional glycosyltransferase family 2 protein/CDP-glycerol:glycerophosphate glycerophosphotransferase [Streptomyces kaniharaensis]|uniref:Bifunctional glycosyltransferase family 2 protein/CDP-glycerol:glycerophosphate glycerophosphotransferase n=1 Tax=Streptomyces kaniharaensis TaxID=212423 RepID=A0A6N7KTY5_9ACTN|nr:bifunctional glycosyltransferase family 2 protein/CDP-glycerol:glycerophosphate glycerophosphotransferase [Streptomyces kaniharaensis]MQS15102.1 bifunctional glycosyltransferase family 2 protein/CDP-glycerol:glycerophosphate glycerophosphotransferase [Streptomyces kaniharaensis]